jgi:hypothetical protein
MRNSYPLYLMTAIITPWLTACQGDLSPLTSKIRLDGLQSGIISPTPDAGSQSPPPARPTAPAPVAASTPASQCAPDVVQMLLTPASIDSSAVKLNCSVQLPANAAVMRQVVFEGNTASGATLDCGGGTLGGRGEKGDRESLIVKSKKTGDNWGRPVGVTVKNCRITGGIRVYGLGRNGEAGAVKQSSMNADHTKFAQLAAPTNVTFDRVQIVGSGGVPFYISPGVTNVTLSNSTIEGTSTSAAIYLDAESAGAKVVNNVFNIETEGRELIAVDGSAYNEISGNKFGNVTNGGIFAYRNCGEGGTIRHQTPQFNRIQGNTFTFSGRANAPAVWLNSRNGNRSYCFSDPGHPFGSSLSPMDFAQNNVVEGNVVVGAGGEAFRNSDPTNRISGNRE